ncbi:MAG: HAD-IB family hydrolase, partial [Anaerolineae bacterium]|nr:HAD-IB family hydrolase [Anaerolineae bacterium]
MPEKQIIALFDLDGTLYDGHVWEALWRYNRTHKTKLGTLYFFMLYHMPYIILQKLGLISRELSHKAWGEHMPWMFRNITPQQAEKIWIWMYQHEIKSNLRPDILAKIAQHKKAGHLVWLVSGAFQPLIELIAGDIGADMGIGTQLKQKNGRYTGGIIKPLNIGNGKKSRILSAVKDTNIDLTISHFYTDSITDLAVIEIVGSSCVVYPDP